MTSHELTYEDQFEISQTWLSFPPNADSMKKIFVRCLTKVDSSKA